MKRILVLLAIFVTTTAQAEPYLGLSVGASFNNNISNIDGKENLNYPDAPDNTDPTTSLLNDAKYSILHLKTSGTVGVKGGYYFDNSPFGVEGEFTYSQPDFKAQNVTITHPGIASVTGGADNFTEDQQPAHTNLYVLALNGLYRYKGLGDFVPYIGGGPAVYVWQIHGTGLSGIIPALGQTGTPGPTVSETPVTWGANFKLGMEYKITQDWGVGLEYRYNWSAFNISEFRSVSDGAGDYQGQAVGFSITRHFN